MPPEDNNVDQSATVTTEETQQPAEVVSSVEGAENGATPVEVVDTPDAQPDAQHEPPKWAQKRIDQLTREKHEERRQREALEALYAARDTSQGAGQPTLTQADVDTRARQIATQQIKQEKFDTACNTAYEQGKKEFTDFDAALQNFKLLGGLPPEFLEITTEIPDGHKVLYALGKNPEEASRVLSLPPLQMAIEVARLADKVGKPAAKPVSSAPAPITPIDGTARVEADPEKMSTAEWMRWRNENRRKST